MLLVLSPLAEITSNAWTSVVSPLISSFEASADCSLVFSSLRRFV